MEIPLFSGLTTAQIAGLIAVGIFILQILFSLAWPLILVSILSESETAVTWSVTSRILNNSYWPVVLRTDTAAAAGVRKKVQTISWGILLTTVLVSVAAIVTPLGLYEDIAPQRTATFVNFHYVKDSSALGAGTPPRPDLGFSRICRGGLMTCPNTDQNITLYNVTSSTGYNSTYAEAPQGYNTRIPRKVYDFWNSGVALFNGTISSPFDIQWRTWRISAKNASELTVFNGSYFNNGSAYAIGAYRPIANLLLNDKWDAVEGLVVDSKTGGIGFRNHTVPSTYLPYGGRWSEDLLFVEPVTECVGLNFSLDFRLTRESQYGFSDVHPGYARFVDHGGFVDINRQPLPYRPIGNQTDPLLSERAYTQAWITNMLTMLIWNITDWTPGKGITIEPPFSYLNSHRDMEITLPQGRDKQPILFRLYHSLAAYSNPGNFITNFVELPYLALGGSNVSNIGNYTDLPPNPFRIGTENFTNFIPRCTGLFNKTPSFDTVGGACGLVAGVPQRKDGSSSILFEADSEWTTPLYSCASANRAIVKTVEFGYNSSTGLDGLSIRDIKPKSYSDPSKYPLWAVEYGDEWSLTWLKPLWGIVAKEDASMTNLSYTRAPHLWLSADIMLGLSGITQNLAAAEFPAALLDEAYSIGSPAGSGSTVGDYSGAQNLPLYNLWKNLSSSPRGAAAAINLIWTDLAANAVVGTRGWIPPDPPPNLAKRDVPADDVAVPIYMLSRSTKYRLRYAIPAILVLLLIVAALAASFLAMVFGRVSLGRLKMFLSRLSTGRIMTAFLAEDAVIEENASASSSSSTTRWLKRNGRTVIDVSSRTPRAVGQVKSDVPQKWGAQSEERKRLSLHED